MERIRGRKVKKSDEPATALSTGVKGMNVVNANFRLEPSIPQPDTNREIDIATFADHLLDCAKTNSRQFIGDESPPPIKPIKINPLADRGTGLYFPEHRN